MGGDLADNRGEGLHGRTNDSPSMGSLPPRVESCRSAPSKSLEAEGFTAEEIRDVEKVVPDLNVLVYRPRVGRSIADAADAAIELRNLSGKPVAFKFNDTLLVASKDDSPASLTERYLAPFIALQSARWSPERIAAHNAEKEARSEALEKTFESLPEFLRAWVVGNGTANYGRELDIEVARDAKLVADTLKTVEAVKQWYRSSHDEQQRHVPGLSEGHSGFSFSQMAHLAIAYLEHTQKNSRAGNGD